MSQVPKDEKPKYNNHEAFRWVDAQWEKFMTEQKEHRTIIKQLQEDLATCTKNFQIQRQQMEELVKRVPSKYLTTVEFNGELPPHANHTTWDSIPKSDKYIYESPDGGKTMYRRKFGDYDNKEQVDKDGNPISVQLEMFPPNDVY